MGEPGQLIMSAADRKRFGYLKPPRNWRTLVGLAGLVAEHMAARKDGGLDVGDAVSTDIFCGDVSDTDAAMIGDKWRDRDVDKVVDLLIAHWDELELEADTLGKYPRRP